MKYLFSACLLGVNCRYDGGNSLREDILQIFIENGGLVICPEQLGGLPTPRPPAQFYNGSGEEVLEDNARVKQIETGIDVTENFKKGALETLRLAQLSGVEIAYLKDKSPSCGVNHVYINGELKEGRGVTAALLKKNGIKVIGVK
jgi:uncharacterized protein YbbK (DUF523 family)